MKILYFVEGNGGGAVSHVLNLAKALPKDRMGHLVFFFLGGPSVKDAEDLGLSYKLVPRKSCVDLALLRTLLKTIAEEEADIIHTHTITGNFYARLAKLLCPRSAIALTTVHSHIIDELRASVKITVKDRVMYLREICTRPVVDHFISVTEEIKQRLVQSGVQDKRITVINNGVQCEYMSNGDIDKGLLRKEFDIKEEEVIVSTIGRLVPLKNHHLFLKAARLVRESLPSSRFLIVGDGPLLHAMKEEAEKLGLLEAVIFTGWRHDVKRILSITDIYVICSSIEGLNLSVLEAMASAKPVVGTNVRGISELVKDHETGILVPPDDANALAKSILKLAKNEELCIRMGMMGRELIGREYSIQQMVDKTIKVYESLCQDL